jgi:hypothetical protein
VYISRRGIAAPEGQADSGCLGAGGVFIDGEAGSNRAGKSPAGRRMYSNQLKIPRGRQGLTFRIEAVRNFREEWLSEAQ